MSFKWRYNSSINLIKQFTQFFGQFTALLRGVLRLLSARKYQCRHCAIEPPQVPPSSRTFHTLLTIDVIINYFIHSS